MLNQPLFSSDATSRDHPEGKTGGASPIRMSMRELAEQKLDQLGRYIRAACSSEEDDRWNSSKEPR
jgi:hypothetical protein